jgi:hypothetical protein
LGQIFAEAGGGLAIYQYSMASAQVIDVHIAA